MPGPPVGPVIAASEAGTRQCVECDVQTVEGRCWVCNGPTLPVVAKRQPSDPGGRWWVCRNLHCELAGVEYWGHETTVCPECQLLGTPIRPRHPVR
jgi:hypothetical protein